MLKTDTKLKLLGQATRTYTHTDSGSSYLLSTAHIQPETAKRMEGERE